MKKIIVNTIILILFWSGYSLISAVGKRYYEGRMQEVYEEHYSRDMSTSMSIDEFLALTNDIPDQAVNQLVDDIKQAQIITVSLQVLLFPLIGWLLTRANRSKSYSSNCLVDEKNEKRTQ
jgi:hypothetical protein